MTTRGRRTLTALAVLAVVWGTKHVLQNLYIWTVTRHHTVVRSAEDNGDYTVLRGVRQQEAADLIARVRRSALAVVAEVSSRQAAGSVPENVAGGVGRIVNTTKSHGLKVYELDFLREDELAYNRNKRDGIFICLRKNVNTGELARDDTILFILLHEMAHTMTPHFDPTVQGATVHSPLFRLHEAYLHEVARQLHLLDPTRVVGRDHCRSTIQIPQAAN
jgi:hypothetical protein